ncbi:MAG: hypothetical protein H7A40_04455 [Chlamydiales bacterium]|nr:hypothetical protein [Chlamydiales bacterium]
MQLCALDDKDLIYAFQAVKNKDYICPECSTRVRLRGGRFQQLHFFHLSTNPIGCRQHAKSLIHLRTQQYISSQFAESFMEYYFPEINRFADVVIPSEKLIFEVQCSPISLFEVRARQAAYAKTGYQLVWILHDARFNRRGLSDAESHLLNSTCYYTDMDAFGNGRIYDQFTIRSNVKRLYIGKKCPVDIGNPLCIKKIQTTPKSKKIRIRQKNWPLYFKNDLIDRSQKSMVFASSLKRQEALCRLKQHSKFTNGLKKILAKAMEHLRSVAFSFAESGQ